jgi:hypothetical protein
VRHAVIRQQQGYWLAPLLQFLDQIERYGGEIGRQDAI